jgi:hypothetical protein
MLRFTARFTELILAADQKNYHAWQHRYRCPKLLNSLQMYMWCYDGYFSIDNGSLPLSSCGMVNLNLSTDCWRMISGLNYFYQFYVVFDYKW